MHKALAPERDRATGVRRRASAGFRGESIIERAIQFYWVIEWDRTFQPHLPPSTEVPACWPSSILTHVNWSPPAAKSINGHPLAVGQRRTEQPLPAHIVLPARGEGRRRGVEVGFQVGETLGWTLVVSSCLKPCKGSSLLYTRAQCPKKYVVNLTFSFKESSPLAGLLGRWLPNWLCPTCWPITSPAARSFLRRL